MKFHLAFSRVKVLVFCVLGLLVLTPFAGAQGLISSDLSRYRSVGAVALSPDGHRLAYSIVMRDTPGRPYGQLWIMDLATQKSLRLGGEKDRSGGPVWSSDGKWLAFQGRQGDKGGLFIARPDGSDVTYLASPGGTNSPLPGAGNEVCWSPDGKQIAFISSTPGAEAAEASGDPMVITRYLYKPDAGEGMTRFNDNQRLHIFVVDVASKQIRQLTKGNTDEHSIDWSPDGKEILYATNPEPNQDEFFNYDVFALKVADNSIRRLTATEFIEYEPLWSPDGKHIVFRGTRRGLTDRETTMEDTHVWVMNADGSGRRNRRSHRQPPGPAPMVARRQRRVFHHSGARKQLFDATTHCRRQAGVHGERDRRGHKLVRGKRRDAGLRLRLSA
jgi:Tol biopolymer transport system component